MRIPEVRRQLLTLADQAEEYATEGLRLAQHMRRLEAELYRRTPKKRAPPSRKTPPKAVVVALAQANPQADQMALAETLGCNSGRISEHLYGKRA